MYVFSVISYGYLHERLLTRREERGQDRCSKSCYLSGRLLRLCHHILGLLLGLRWRTTRPVNERCFSDVMNTIAPDIYICVRKRNESIADLNDYTRHPCLHSKEKQYYNEIISPRCRMKYRCVKLLAHSSVAISNKFNIEVSRVASSFFAVQTAGRAVSCGCSKLEET